MALHKKQEAICQGVGQPGQLATELRESGPDPAGLGRLEEAMALLKKQEAICLELEIGMAWRIAT
jgi:hypothetical protein